MVLIYSNLYGNYQRQTTAIDSWIHFMDKHPNTIKFAAAQFEDDQKMHNIEYDFCLKRSSLDFIENGIKKMPIVRDILQSAYEKIKDDNSYTHFGWINSDILVTDNLMKFADKQSAIAVSRLDIQEEGSFADYLQNGVKIIRNEIAGFDLIILSKDWWTKYGNLLQPYILGCPVFDQIWAGIIAITGGELYNDPQQPMICHIQHPIKWQGNSPEKEWNINLKKSNPFDHICFNMMHYHLQHNLTKRLPWGAFMIPQPGEKEFTKDFFDIFSLETPKQIKYNA